MKASVAALGFAAGLTQVNAYHPHHWHFRRDNSTLPGDAQTTLTVIATEVTTITSCAPQVPDCPANPTEIEELPESEKTTVVVTNTVALTTTVCPVSDAPSISASIIGEQTGIVGTTLTEPPVPGPSVPVGTGITPPITSATALPEVPEDGVSLITTVSEVVTDHTLTITQGTGTDTTVKTTTIKTTYDSTIVVTAGDELTTTTTATSTGTTTVTVDGPQETTDELSEGNGPPVDGEGEEEDGSCVCPTAVTVTAPASTVFVTIGGDGPSTVGDVAIPTGGSDDDEDEDDEDEDECEAIPDEDEDEDDEDVDECEPDTTTTLSATVTVPFPTGNGTASATGIPGPTGFAYLRR